MSGKGRIGIVGSGVIGKSWAMIFASQGYEVSLISTSSHLSPNKILIVTNGRKTIHF